LQFPPSSELLVSESPPAPSVQWTRGPYVRLAPANGRLECKQEKFGSDQVL